jgi:hypothetical protein
MDSALPGPQHRERQVAVAGPAAVADVAAHEREGHVLALVQLPERPDPERWRVVRDEQDRLHRSASS